MKTVAGFDRYQDAEQAVSALQKLGLNQGQIGVIARESVLRKRMFGENEVPSKDPSKSIVGGTAVGGLGGILVGIGSSMIPGLGPIVTAGTLLSTTLAGAGIGAATGGIISMLKSTGISEEDAHVHAEGVRRGGVLLTVEAEEEKAQAVFEALDRANPVDVTVRREELQREGWQGFDETREPELLEEDEDENRTSGEGH